jgi:hypothetical protein
VTKGITRAATSDDRNGINHAAAEGRTYCFNLETATAPRRSMHARTYITRVAQENRVIAVTYETISGMRECLIEI